ncbi:MAG: indolepyruvate ferredoxin oxidoreductase subunit alpha [Eubacteriales bacterium]|jgi:indolepyruvate ferredoxin oxidoreductase alpha subunit
MKKLMLGNEAVARGLYEAGVSVVSSYPGTPSTEITEEVAKYEEVYAEWAPNEKVAAEVAFGACMGGARSFCGQKHVGLNVAADLLFTASYTGVNGGFVIAVADDQGMHSSQNEQDSRYYAISSKVPMLEPSDSQECKDFAKLAYDISEEYDTPVLLRLSTRVSHSQSLVELGERKEVPLKPYEKNMGKYVMMPAPAQKRHVVVEERTLKLTAYAEKTPLNQIIPGDRKIGIIAGGIAYQYAREALGDRASYLKLGMINPLPVDLIREFASQVDKLYVIEELEDIIESHCRKNGIQVEGKALFSRMGEYTPNEIRKQILGEEKDLFQVDVAAPGRPPVLCPGCPHRGIFYTLSKLKVAVSGDIGCYTLGALPPLSAMDSTICMGASISGLHGLNKARGTDFARQAVAVIGDSTFMHSGITGLCDTVYNKGVSTIIVLDNSITGMTGHQQNPTTGKTLKGEPTYAIDIQKICEAAGVRRVRVIDPFDIQSNEAVIREELDAMEPSVIITRRPCALLPEVKPLPPLKVDADKCKSCKMCMKIGCPAISMKTGKAEIDPTLCVGCDLCVKMCKFDAICGGDK